jgi:hypothetical protein
MVNYTNGPTNTLDYDNWWMKYKEDKFIGLTDFDYFDRFYTTSTASKIIDSDCNSYVELFEVKSVNKNLYL